MSKFLKKRAESGAASFKTITASNAVELVLNYPMPDINGLDFDPVEASRLKLKRFSNVEVFPADSGKSDISFLTLAETKGYRP